MLFSVFLFLLGLLLLIAGAEGFVRGGSGIALRFHIPEYAIGATVVAVGTSLPEVFTSGYASFKGTPDVALGNVLGSNVFNVALVLGLSCALFTVRFKRDIFTLDAPSFLVSIILLFLLAFDGFLSRPEGFLFLILYVVYVIRLLKEREVPEEGLIRIAPQSLLISFVFLIFAIVSLFIGSRLTVNGAVMIAREVGISEWVIAASAVAAGTSLPEFSTTVVAAIRGRRALAVGNVIGSNVTNIYLVLGVAAMISPLKVSKLALHFDIPFVFLLSLVLIFMVSGKRITRESGISLLAAFLGYLWAILKVHKIP